MWCTTHLVGNRSCSANLAVDGRLECMAISLWGGGLAWCLCYLAGLTSVLLYEGGCGEGFFFLVTVALMAAWCDTRSFHGHFGTTEQYLRQQAVPWQEHGTLHVAVLQLVVVDLGWCGWCCQEQGD
jgi:hypothetical protein